ncbi:MAG: quinolinate synthase NadA [Krumholzibacteria bacterium]|nr:quinolinate synthase NadA [Candidatus Krumholzibacteria bacterium]
MLIPPGTVAVDPGLDLFAEIDRLRRELNAVILAHYYQEPDIQDVADFVGDSLALSQKAAAADAEVIVFAGVHFMAETAKILNPHKQVLLPDLEAGCSLADGCPPDRFAAFLARYPGHKVVSYINCSAATKAQSDVICTSSNAVKIVASFPADQPLVFAPDRFLGAWVARQLGRDLVLWPGSCEVHEVFSEKALVGLKVAHPQAKVAAHPECPEAVLQHADYVGSTTGILEFARRTDAPAVIVVTEPGILHQMRKESPGKELIPVPGADESCSCNECPYMKKNTLQKLYLCMRDRTPQVTVDPAIAARALVPIRRMLELSR